SHVPQFDGPQPVAAGQSAAVGGERQPKNAALVPPQGTDCLARGGGVQPHVAVCCTAGPQHATKGEGSGGYFVYLAGRSGTALFCVPDCDSVLETGRCQLGRVV